MQWSPASGSQNVKYTLGDHSATIPEATLKCQLKLEIHFEEMSNALCVQYIFTCPFLPLDVANVTR